MTFFHRCADGSYECDICGVVITAEQYDALGQIDDCPCCGLPFDKADTEP